MQSEKPVVHIVSNDSRETRKLSHFFVSRGLDVVAFRTAAEYVVAKRDNRPACLILDLILPDLDGLEIQRRLTGSGAPPIVFVTGRGDAVSVARAMKNGAIDFLIEPIDYSQLIADVELAFREDLRRRKELFETRSLLVRWQTLTPRETQVFHHTVAGLLNKQAADELGVAENTYQVHRGRVMRKMKAGSLAELVRMSTKLEPILERPHEKDSVERYLSTEMASVEPVHQRVYTLAGTTTRQAMAARPY